MKILVTGGAGYIGSHVVLEFIAQGHEVTIIDDLSLGLEENIDPRATFVKGSTLSESDLQEVFQNKFDGVVHLAACKAAGESMIDPGKYAQNNLNGTMNLINACDQQGIKKLFFHPQHQYMVFLTIYPWMKIILPCLLIIMEKLNYRLRRTWPGLVS